MAPKKIVLKKKSQKKEAGDTYAGIPQDLPQLKTRKLKAPRPKIVTSDSEEPDESEGENRFKFYCVRCGQKLGARAEWAGREVECTTCHNKIEIPEPLED